MADAIIKVNKLVKKYGEFTAVKGISFEVKEGKIFIKIPTFVTA